MRAKKIFRGSESTYFRMTSNGTFQKGRLLARRGEGWGERWGDERRKRRRRRREGGEQARTRKEKKAGRQVGRSDESSWLVACGEVDGGTVVRCKVNGLEPPRVSGARDPAVTWLFPRSIPKHIDSTEFQAEEKTSTLTLTIGEALLGQIVASSLVTNGGTRFATFVVATAILDGGAMLLTTLRSVVIQRGGRGADHQQHYDQQPRCRRRRIHPRIVTRCVLSSPTTNTRFEVNDARKNRPELETYSSCKNQACVSKILKLVYEYMKVNRAKKICIKLKLRR